MKRLLLLALCALFLLSMTACAVWIPKETGDRSEKTFTFEAYDLDGTRLYGGEITSNAATVGEALTEKGLIEGDKGPYGLYVKTVCGVLGDYDVNQTYWAFYIGGEYAMSGVDKTAAEDGETYILRREK